MAQLVRSWEEKRRFLAADFAFGGKSERGSKAFGKKSICFCCWGQPPVHTGRNTGMVNSVNAG